MALKNWKLEKHTHDKNEIAFWRNNIDYYNGFVSIYKIEKGAPAWDSGKYSVEISAGHDLESRYFKTKSQAIKYARQYMRTH